MQVLAGRLGLALACSASCAAMGGCRREAPPAFDLPAAMGADFHADIDALSSRLGAPISTGTNESGLPTRTWKKDGATLTAAYKAGSKRVVSLGVIARPDSEALRDDAKTKLLRAATLPESEGASAYSIEWIEAKDRPTFSVGFRVVPAPRTHKVTLRVSGTEAILTIAFQPPATTGGQSGALDIGSGAPFMTAPPWQTTLPAVPDDAKVVLQSRIYRSLDDKVLFAMQAQIEVDGKVVRDQKSSGLPISLDYDL